MVKGLTPAQQKQLLALLLGAIALVVWFALFFVPQKQSLSEVRGKLDTLQAKLTQLKDQLERFPGQQTKLETLIAQVELPAVVPSAEEQLPELLEEMAQLARAAQVSLAAVKPKLELDVLAAGESGYLELPLEVKTTGGYHQIGLFLDALESSESLVRVEGMEIHNSSEDVWRHEATFLLRAYLFPPRSSRGR